MALFDSLNKMAKNIGEMAGDAMENGKINIKIMEEKGKLSEAYAQLGEIMYQQAKSGEDKSVQINELLIRIDDHHTAIEAAQAQAKANQAEVQPAPAFTAQDPPAAQAAPKFCANCGAKLDEGSRFCGSCGTQA